jgi:hypothetical protein
LTALTDDDPDARLVESDAIHRPAPFGLHREPELPRGDVFGEQMECVQTLALEDRAIRHDPKSRRLLIEIRLRLVFARVMVFLVFEFATRPDARRVL